MSPICYIFLIMLIASVLIIGIPFMHMIIMEIPPSFKIECLIVVFAAIFIWLPILNIFHAVYCAKVIKEHTNKMMRGKI